MRYLLYIVLIVFVFFTAPGCSSEDQAPQRPSIERRVAAKKKKTRTKKAPVTEQASSADKQTADTDKYSYSSAGKPDPFRPLIADMVTRTATARDRTSDRAFLTPLQKYELKDLKLVAVVVSGDEPTAMLEDPTGYGYMVRKGTLVGPNDGVVERVTQTGIIIREKIYNSLGEIETRISTITIQHVE